MSTNTIYVMAVQLNASRNKLAMQSLQRVIVETCMREILNRLLKPTKRNYWNHGLRAIVRMRSMVSEFSFWSKCSDSDDCRVGFNCARTALNINLEYDYFKRKMICVGV